MSSISLHKVFGSHVPHTELPARGRELNDNETMRRMLTIFMVAIVGVTAALVSIKLVPVITPLFYLAHELHTFFRNNDELLRTALKFESEHNLYYNNTPLLTFVQQIFANIKS